MLIGVRVLLPARLIPSGSVRPMLCSKSRQEPLTAEGANQRDHCLCWHRFHARQEMCARVFGGTSVKPVKKHVGAHNLQWPEGGEETNQRGLGV